MDAKIKLTKLQAEELECLSRHENIFVANSDKQGVRTFTALLEKGLAVVADSNSWGKFYARA